VHDVAVPEVVLRRARIDAVVGELEAAGMAQHVRMHFNIALELALFSAMTCVPGFPVP
jgi:hypothetical protein